MPTSWSEYVIDVVGHARAGADDRRRARPAWLSWETGYDPADALDRAVLATRTAVFPLLGLDPYFD